MSCSLHHQGLQLILAYSWARPAILVADKGRGGMFLLCPFSMGEGGAYIITAVGTYVHPVRLSRPSGRPVRNTIGKDWCIGLKFYTQIYNHTGKM